MPIRPFAREQRHAHPALDAPAAVRLVPEMLEAGRDVRDDDRLAPLDDRGGGIVGIAPVEALSEQLVQVREAVPADDDHLVAVHLLHAAAVVRNRLAQLGEDQVEHLAQAQACC